jgi:hypothetical protein
MRRDSRNNLDVCREVYTPVNAEVQDTIRNIKITTNTLIESLGILLDKQHDPNIRRLLAMARTDYEAACMWAVKGLTSEELQWQEHTGGTGTGGLQR